MTSSRRFPARLSLYLAVGVGSAIGGTLRWWLSVVLQSPAGAVFPWSTLWANVSGSLLIGGYAALVAPGKGRTHSLRLRLFVMTGFCGGYTSFSIFSLESLRLLQLGRHGLAAANVGGSLLLWLMSGWLGYQLVSSMRRAA